MHSPIRGRVLPALGALALLVPTVLVAQSPQDACRKAAVAFAARHPGAEVEDDEGCDDLAARVTGQVGGAFFLRAAASRARDTALLVTPRKTQSTRGMEANSAGAPGQGEAVAATQPTAIASANLAATGTDNGAKTLATISLNPITLFGGASDAAAAARWSRFGDLSVLVPISDASTSTDKLGYFGLRLRLNLTGLKAGDRLLRQVDTAFKATLQMRADLLQQLTEAFEALGDSDAISACADAVVKAKGGDRPAECGGRVTLGFSETSYRAFREVLARAREQADAKYFGLDLRFDTGDPTLAGDSTRDVTALQAGLAFGRRSVGSDPRATAFGLQGRVGARYSQLRSQSDSVTWSLDVAVGFEASRLVSETQAVRFTAALEGRYAGESKPVAEQHQTDNLVLRGGLQIPVMGGTSITVAGTAPLTGEVSPTLSVNFNWALLMSGLASGAH